MSSMSVWSGFDFEYWHIKIIYDAAGYIAAFGVTWWYSKKVFHPGELPNPFAGRMQRAEYMLVVLAAAMLGAVCVSTFDGMMITERQLATGVILSKSIAGAIFGGVIGAEGYKYLRGIRVATGILFLPGIVVGVLVGRVGAIATGLRDFTYGLPTHLPWGMDFGDGILRHPTMIYEMVLLGVFLIVFSARLASAQRAWWIQNGFYVFVVVYFIYRFLVGFIQPYSTFWWGLSTYQAIAIPMVIYGGYKLFSQNAK